MAHGRYLCSRFPVLGSRFEVLGSLASSAWRTGNGTRNLEPYHEWIKRAGIREAVLADGRRAWPPAASHRGSRAPPPRDTPESADVLPATAGRAFVADGFRTPSTPPRAPLRGVRRDGGSSCRRSANRASLDPRTA